MRNYEHIKVGLNITMRNYEHIKAG